MIYTPQKYPRQTITVITMIVIFAIVLGYLVDELFIVVGIVYWMQYTIALSYLQLKKGSKHPMNTITNILLNAPIRFLLFQSAAVSGLVAVIKYNDRFIGSLVLVIWWIFAYNFYYHYTKK